MSILDSVGIASKYHRTAGLIAAILLMSVALVSRAAGDGPGEFTIQALSSQPDVPSQVLSVTRSGRVVGQTGRSPQWPVDWPGVVRHSVHRYPNSMQFQTVGDQARSVGHDSWPGQPWLWEDGRLTPITFKTENGQAIDGAVFYLTQSGTVAGQSMMKWIDKSGRSSRPAITWCSWTVLPDGKLIMGGYPTASLFARHRLGSIPGLALPLASTTFNTMSLTPMQAIDDAGQPVGIGLELTGRESVSTLRRIWQLHASDPVAGRILYSIKDPESPSGRGALVRRTFWIFDGEQAVRVNDFQYTRGIDFEFNRRGHVAGLCEVPTDGENDQRVIWFYDGKSAVQAEAPRGRRLIRLLDNGVLLVSRSNKGDRSCGIMIDGKYTPLAGVGHEDFAVLREAKYADVFWHTSRSFVGWATLDDRGRQIIAFEYDGESCRQIGRWEELKIQPGQSVHSQPVAQNAAGQIVGTTYVGDARSSHGRGTGFTAGRPWIDDGKTTRPIPLPAGATEGDALWINADGAVLGISNLSPRRHPQPASIWVYDGQKTTEIGRVSYFRTRVGTLNAPNERVDAFPTTYSEKGVFFNDGGWVMLYGDDGPGVRVSPDTASIPLPTLDEWRSPRNIYHTPTQRRWELKIQRNGEKARSIWPTFVRSDGMIGGVYELPLNRQTGRIERRVFLWTPETGVVDLADRLNVGLKEAGWVELDELNFIDADGRIYGRGQRIRTKPTLIPGPRQAFVISPTDLSSSPEKTETSPTADPGS